MTISPHLFVLCQGNFLCSVAPITAPLDPKIHSVGKHSATMEWTPYKKQDITITCYKVQYWKCGISNTVSMAVHAYKPQFMVDSLEADTKYEFNVAAQSAHGCGPFSAPVCFQTLGKCGL